MGVAGLRAVVPEQAHALRALRRRPQLVAEVSALVAWVALLGHALASTGGLHRHDDPSPWGAWGSWLVMSAAMMLPAAVPAARHVGVNSLRWRRHRAVGTYVAVFLGVWAAYGVMALVLVAGWTVTLTGALAVAAVWQFTPRKRRFLRDCHRTVPLPATGWRATMGAVRFGARNAAACVGSCWALMLVMAVPASHHFVVAHLLGTGALTAAVAAEKLLPRPRRTSRLVGIALTVAALGSAVAG